MKLNVYKSQTEVEKTYETQAYDLMYGTVEDIFEILDGMENMKTNDQIIGVIQKNRAKLTELLKDVFPEITDDELRRIKLKELVPFFIELFGDVQRSFSEKN